MRANGWERAAHGVAGFEQGLVEDFAVVGDQNVEAGEVLRLASGAAKALRRNRA